MYATYGTASVVSTSMKASPRYLCTITKGLPHQEAERDAADRHADELHAPPCHSENTPVSTAAHRELVDPPGRLASFTRLFALEHGDHVAGDSEPREDGRRRHRVPGGETIAPSTNAARPRARRG